MAGRGAQNSKAVWMLVLMLWCITVRGQNVVFEDEIAGRHLDYISDRGIKLLLLWRHRFMARMNAIRDILDESETTLTDHFSQDNLPNITGHMQDNLVSIAAKLDQAESLLNSVNLTEKDQGQPAFLKTNDNTVNIGDHYDDTMFVVPMDGLYMVTIKNSYYYASQTLKAMKNSADTITSLTTTSYYDVQVRYALVELVAGDEITITTSGSTPAHFGVNLLRLQTLMPSLL